MASTGEARRLGHRPALDGLRGIAILLVLVGHLTPWGAGAAGKVGVTVFFALSGFLITALLLAESERHGRIRLGHFYLRRARRLLPALVACLIGVVGLGLLVQQPFVSAGGVLSAMFYVANIVKANHLVDLGALAHTWSLSVEEQFYLVWPLALILAHRWAGRRGVAALAGAGVVVAVGLRLVLWTGDAEVAWRIYYSSWCRIDALLLGCLLAALMPLLQQRFRQVPRGAVAGGLGLLLVPWCFTTGWWLYVAMPLVVALVTLGLILAATSEHRGPRWMAGARLRWFGRRSYALYLWHYPFVILAGLRFPDVAWWVTGPVVLLVSLVVAEISWRCVERPALRRSPAVVTRLAPDQASRA